MEAFSLIKFWRNAGGDDAADFTNASRETSIATSNVDLQVVESDDETDNEDSFFDLEFTVPDFEEKEEIKPRKGETRCDFVESPISKPLSPISLLRSPQKFRVFLLGFKKSKFEKTETNGASMASPKNQPQKSSISKRFTVKCTVEEVPILSLFTRENSLRSKIMNDSSKRFPKDVVQKYLNLIKPLYVRVSKRYSEKMKFSEHLSKSTPSSSPATAPLCSPRKQVDEKQGSRPATLRVVCKHLKKSRSASSAVGVVPSPVSRRDDSLLQQHDGIQSAILHCKRSFNSSTESSLLSRSESDTCHEKSIRPLRKFIEEKNRCSI